MPWPTASQSTAILSAVLPVLLSLLGEPGLYRGEPPRPEPVRPSRLVEEDPDDELETPSPRKGADEQAACEPCLNIVIAAGTGGLTVGITIGGWVVCWCRPLGWHHGGRRGRRSLARTSVPRGVQGGPLET